MKGKLLVTGLVLSLVVTSSAMAFDGRRKGFVLGGGLGLAPIATWEGDLGNISDFEDTGIGGGLQILIGYAWDEFNMIVYEGNGVAYESEVFIVDFTAYQGFTGASWYHYFGPSGRTFFTVVGIGFYFFEGEFEHTNVTFENDPGGGVLFGGGYEFARHWQVAGFVSAGRTSEPGIDYDHTHVNVLVSGVAF
jgi:hypothetical protein